MFSHNVKKILFFIFLLCVVGISVVAFMHLVTQQPGNPISIETTPNPQLQNTFIRQTQGSFEFVGRSKENDLTASLGKTDNSAVVQVEHNNNTLAFSQPLDNPRVSQKGDLIVYQDGENQGMIIYQITSKGLKEEIILNSPKDIKASYLYALNSLHLIYKKVLGLWTFYDENDTDYLRPLFLIPQPYMVDANKTRSETANIKPIQKDGTVYLELKVDTDWLDDPRRAFPIIIDPSINTIEDRGSEVVSQRSANVKTYSKDGQLMRSDFHSNPIHYQDASNAWQDIDTEVVSSDDPNYDFMNLTNRTKTYFSSKAFGNNSNVKIEKGDASINFSTLSGITIIDKNNTEASYSAHDLKPQTLDEQTERVGRADTIMDNKILYPKIYALNGDILDVSYQVLDYKIKEEITMNRYFGIKAISQDLELTNVYAKHEGNQIKFYHKQTDEFLWEITPRMYEKNNEAEANFGLHFEITCKDANTSLDLCNRLTLTKIIDPEGISWLSDPKRQYPVVIDPDYSGTTDDVIIYGNDAGSGTYTPARDTSASYRNWENFIIIGQAYTNARGDHYEVDRSYLKFDTSGIPSTATITQVNLKVTVQWDTSDTDFDVQIVKLDWSGQDPVNTNNRETAYDNCLSGTADNNILMNTNGVSVNTQYASGNLATNWPNKGVGAYTYYCLRSSRDYNNTQPSGGELIDYYSQDESTSSYRPILTINWTIPPATKLNGVNLNGVNIN